MKYFTIAIMLLYCKNCNLSIFENAAIYKIHMGYIFQVGKYRNLYIFLYKYRENIYRERELYFCIVLLSYLTAMASYIIGTEFNA